MSLQQGEQIGAEVHKDRGQFFRVENEKGEVSIDRQTHKSDDAIVVPAVPSHNLINTGDKPLKLYTRIAIAALIYSMVNAALFGIGLIIVLTVPALSAHANTLVPAVVVAGLILAMPVSWIIAPRLRARYWRHRSASVAL